MSEPSPSMDEGSTTQSGVIGAIHSDWQSWRYIPGPELARSADDPFLPQEVRAAIVRLNPEARSADRVEQLLQHLRRLTLSAVNDGLVPTNESFTTWLKGAQTIRYTGDALLSPVRLIDFDEPHENSFVLSSEVIFSVGSRRRRFDIVLWVNGFPLVIGETKSPVRAGTSWLAAAQDISLVYAKECTPIFVCNLFSFATDGRELHYGAVGSRAENWPMWGSSSDPPDFAGWERVRANVSTLCSPRMILNILENYTLFERRLKSTIKLIPRYPQVEAAERILSRVTYDGESRGGLIWHFQGTGKTLLMGFVALRLLGQRDVSVRTVLIVLDRVDLVEQAVRQFRTIGLPRLQVAASRDDLQELLTDGSAEIVVTTIFKFAGSSLIDRSENVVVLIDEAHRTQEGELGVDLRRALPSAWFFGFTGTPVADSQRNTFKLFGDSSDPNWVLSEYTMDRAIEEGASLPIHVEPRLITLQIDSQALEVAFEDLASAEKFGSQERDAIVRRAARIKTIMLAPNRVQTVCADIVEHYLSVIAPAGLKAQVVTLDREMCVLYHEAISRELAERQSERYAAVVMTTGTTKDEPQWWDDRYGLDPSSEALLKARFNDPSDSLSLLIVTSKLLTGFDAPIEGAMYLDKPLRRHTLLQAICRTNRRYTNEATGQIKTAGLVVDYVGVIDNIVDALRSADPSGQAAERADIAVAVRELSAMVRVAYDLYGPPPDLINSFEFIVEVQALLAIDNRTDTFLTSFQSLHRQWEFLWPSDELRDVESQYRWLAMLYQSLRISIRPENLAWARLGAKTLDLVHDSISNVRVANVAAALLQIDPGLLRTLSYPAHVAENASDMNIDDVANEVRSRLERLLDSRPQNPSQVALSARLAEIEERRIGNYYDTLSYVRDLIAVARGLNVTEHGRVPGEAGADSSELLGNGPSLNADTVAMLDLISDLSSSMDTAKRRSLVFALDHAIESVRFDGWQASQPGDRAVRLAMRRVLRAEGLETTGNLFDQLYSLVRDAY